MSTLWDFLNASILAALGGSPELLATLISTGWQLVKKGCEGGGTTEKNSPSIQISVVAEKNARVQINGTRIETINQTKRPEKKCRHRPCGNKNKGKK